MLFRSRIPVCLLAAAVHLVPPFVFAQTLFEPKATTSFSAQLSPESRDFAEKIYRDLSPKSSPAAIGNVAVSLWMIGRLQVALHLMGKAVAADPTNTDNQCNYAAMLTMSGEAKQAIPVLEGLAKKFPENATVLNNLGQAYYQADDEEKAEKALGRALAVAPAHAQAAATQSEIAQGKSDNAKAVALAKQAVQQSVSRDKLNRLRKLGYKLTLEDMKNSRPADPDPLGLHSFIHPPFPTNAIEENRTRREWAAFYKEVQSRLESLQKKLLQVQSPALAQAQAQAAYAQFLSGNTTSGSPAKSGGQTQSIGVGTVQVQSSGPEPVRPFAQKAKLMLDLLNKDGGAKLRLQRAKDALEAFVAKNQQLVEKEYRAEYNKLDRKDANQTGEGLANASFCDKFVSLADKYLGKWSDGREALYNEYLHQLRLKLSEEIYWKQFLESPQEFEATVIKAQMEWLAAFMPSGIRTDGYLGIEVAESCLKEKQAPRGGKLANFNDVHCQYHSELNLGIGSIITDCDRMVSTLGAGPVQLGLNQDMAQGTDFYDSFVSCNVEISAGKDVKAGPVSVGAEAGVGVEIGRNGVQDVYVTGKIEATVINAAGSGAEARMSLVSGSGSANILR
ncbi:MAG: tetratricopeptide repeat protein [Nibricoccus sp.]